MVVKSNSSDYWEWQYNGAGPWFEIIEWCEECIPGEWATNGFETIFFTNRDAYVLFLLRWV